ncbi:MAG TPA: hypothetical protein DCE25_08455 [Pseudomonas sp.]|nr:hypothetical protein [Pseudomonas sp.]
MQTMLDLIHNATLQAWIWGPLMGVILGALFAGLTSAPTVNAPVTVSQTKNVYLTKVIVTDPRASSGDDDKGTMVILIGAGLGLAFLVWKYAVHFDEVHNGLMGLLLTLLAFSLTTAVVSFFKGQFTSSSWALYIAAPCSILVACAALLSLARVSFDPALTPLATQHTFLSFYTQGLSSYGQIFMMFQVLGVALIFLVMVFTGVALLHYLALMNQRSYSPLQGLWIFLTGLTLAFSGARWLFVMALLLGLSALLIEPGLMTKWVTQR